MENLTKEQLELTVEEIQDQVDALVGVELVKPINLSEDLTAAVEEFHNLVKDISPSEDVVGKEKAKAFNTMVEFYNTTWDLGSLFPEEEEEEESGEPEEEAEPETEEEAEPEKAAKAKTSEKPAKEKPAKEKPAKEKPAKEKPAKEKAEAGPKKTRTKISLDGKFKLGAGAEKMKRGFRKDVVDFLTKRKADTFTRKDLIKQYGEELGGEEEVDRYMKWFLYNDVIEKVA